MKKFNQVRIPLFESTMAQFKLSIEALFTKGRPDGSVSNLVYITDKGVANLSPSIYLVFTYKGETYETTKNLYMSYPQLFKLRAVMEQVKDLLVDEKGFVNIDSVLMVKPEYQQPIVVANIGKSSKSVSFTLAAIDPVEEGMSSKIAGVTMKLSDAEYVSVLTAEEYLTIYTIVKDLDLTTVQVQLSTMFLLGEDNLVPVYGQAPVYQQPAYPQQQPGYYQGPTPQPQQTGYSNVGGAPNYQQQPSQKARYGSTPMTRQQPQVRQAPQTAAPQPQNNNLPPRREEKTIVNMKAVQETPVSTVKFDDDSTIDAIFNDDEK
jgi:hypothetical protein